MAEWLGTHRSLVALLAVGVGVRVALLVCYPNAILENYDSARFLALPLFSDPRQPSGYHALLAALRLVSTSTLLIVIVQHLLGIVAGVLAYSLARQCGLSRGWATAAAAPALLAGEMLYLEHAVMTETLMTVLLAGALLCTVRAVHRSSSVWAASAGLLLGGCTITRSIGIPVAIVAIVWVAAVAPGLRGRLRLAGVTALGVAAVLGAYLAIATTGTHAGLLDSSSLASYSRVGQFADCSKFTPPPRTRGLCESTPPATRFGPRWYAGNPDSPGVRLMHDDPAHADSRLGAFARAAALGQPLDYLDAVVVDALRYVREDVRPNPGWTYGTGFAGLEIGWARAEPSQVVVRAARLHYPHIHASSAKGQSFWLLWSGVFRVGGIVFAVLLLASLAATAMRGARAEAILCAGVSLAILLVPVITLIWDARYAAPAYVPLGVGAAITGCTMARRNRLSRSNGRTVALR